MNVLLIMPEISYFYDEWPCPPVGIAYVSAYLKSKEYCNVYTINSNTQEGRIEDYLPQFLKQNKIDVVGCGDLVVNWENVKTIIDIVKKTDKGIKTFIGGGLVNHTPWEAMELIPSADIGVIGEGEEIVFQLIKALNESLNLCSVKGLVFRKKDIYSDAPIKFEDYKHDFVIPAKYNDEVNYNYIFTEEAGEIKDLDSLPWPDYNGFDFFEVFAQDAITKRALVTTSRSCPFKCTFCSHSGGKKYRQRSLDKVFQEIEYLIEKHDVEFLFLNDELFANDMQRVVAFCSRIKLYNVSWICFLRVNKYITTELLELMKNSGCKEIFFGLESADNNVLKSMKKGTTIQEIERVLRITRDSDIAARGNFIFGDPEETMDTVNNTLNWVKENKQLMGSIILSPIQLFPGSKLYIDAVKNGVITDTRDFVRRYCPITNVSKLSNEQYLDLVNKIIPENIRIINEGNIEIKMVRALKEERKYEFSVVCPDCGNEFIFYVNPIGLSTNILYKCDKCDFSSEINTFKAYMVYIDEKLHELLNENKIGIWGIGKIFYTTYEYSRFIRNDKFNLYDSSHLRRQQKFMNRTIHSPEMILEHEIDTILCTVHRTKDIQIEIREKYKKVKTFIWLYDFGFTVNQNKEINPRGVK